MLPFPVYYRIVNCTGLPAPAEQAEASAGNETWPGCRQLRTQAYTFLVFSSAILCLALASRFVRPNRRTEPAIAAMVGTMLAAETVIAACLLADSVAFLGLQLCRDFPTVRLGPVASLALGLNQWLASSCLFYRNWLVALISVSRYRLFRGGGGGGGGGRGPRGSIAGSQHIVRARMERKSLCQFRLASCLLLANAAAFCAFLSLKTVGQVCQQRLWSGPIEVDRFLLAINNATLFLTVNTAVVFPLQVVLPLVIGLAASATVLVTLWRHMGYGSLLPQRQQQHQHQQQHQQQHQHQHQAPLVTTTNNNTTTNTAAANNRKRYRRPFFAFLAMNVALLVLYLPTVVIRVLELLDYNLNQLFWLSNLLCCLNSLTNMLVYFYLCKACGGDVGSGGGGSGGARTATQTERKNQRRLSKTVDDDQ